MERINLDKEFFDWYYKENANDYNANILYEKYGTISKKLAKHFYKLGLESQTKDMQDALRMEYEKGRADALANALTLDEIKGMENQAFLAGIEAERNKSILKKQ